jgi:hypothetical protein
VAETTAHAAICGMHATAARRLSPIVGSPPRKRVTTKSTSAALKKNTTKKLHR